MKTVRRVTALGHVAVALGALHLLGRDAVAAAVALAPNANGVPAAAVESVPRRVRDRGVREVAHTSRGNAGRLAAWWVEARAPARSRTIVLLHGVRTDSALLVRFAESFSDDGYGALLVDLPGHGASEGRFLGYGPAEARRIGELLERLRADGAVSAEPIGVFGFSYGAAVALELAALDPHVGAVVAVSSFASLRSVVSDYRDKYLPAPLKLVPDSWFQGAVDEAAIIAGFNPERGPLWSAARARAPVLYLHGERDDQVPSEHSRRLAAVTPQAELVTVPGMTHDSAPLDGSGALRREAARWFERWLP